MVFESESRIKTNVSVTPDYKVPRKTFDDSDSNRIKEFFIKYFICKTSWKFHDICQYRIFTGTGFMLARIGSGVFDIATFPIPTRSLMQPPTPDGFFETLMSDKEIRNRPPRGHISPRAEKPSALP